MTEEEMQALAIAFEDAVEALSTDLAIAAALDQEADELDSKAAEATALATVKRNLAQALIAAQPERRAAAAALWRQVGEAFGFGTVAQPDPDPIPDPVSPPPPPPPPPAPEPEVVVRTVPLFDLLGVYRNEGAANGSAVIGAHEGKAALVVTPPQWGSAGIFWNGSGVQNFIKAEIFIPANITTGGIALRHGTNWTTVSLNAANNSLWKINGESVNGFAAVPRDAWVELSVDLAGLGITAFKALTFEAGSSADRKPVYFANVGFDPSATAVTGAAPVLPPPPPPPPPPVGDIVLDKFPTTPVQRWNYNQLYHPIEGPQPGKMADGTAFKFEALIPNAQGELIHRFNNTDAAGIKWEAEKKLRKTQGHYIVEATFQFKNGIINAPLWLYSEGDPVEPFHEFDFELMSNRVEYNLHNGSGGFNMKKVDKDLNGHRVRYEIIRRPNLVTMRITSLTDGWTDELVITPEKVADWATRSGAPANLRFPQNTVAMWPLTEVWRSRWPSWSGEYVPLAAGEHVDTVIHGFKFLP